MPVIDINKLPRYGLLAPPLERPPGDEGKYVHYDRATNLFVKNRGTLRANLENKTGGGCVCVCLCVCMCACMCVRCLHVCECDSGATTIM